MMRRCRMSTTMMSGTVTMMEPAERDLGNYATVIVQFELARSRAFW